MSHPATSATNLSLRLVTYNIAGNKSTFSASRIAAVLSSLEPHVVCLQEVSGATKDNTQVQ